MKKIFLLLFCALLIYSCNKDNNNPGNNSQSGSIEYKVNGTLITMDNANILNGEGVVFAKQLKGSAIPKTRYLLNAQKGVNNIVIAAIVTDSLQTSNYHYDSAFSSNNPFTIFAISFNGQQSGIFYNTDYFDFNITSYKNGKISGTFTAKMTPMAGGLNYNNRGAVITTEGKLTNVPVTY